MERRTVPAPPPRASGESRRSSSASTVVLSPGSGPLLEAMIAEGMILLPDEPEIRELLRDKDTNQDRLKRWAKELARMSRGTHRVSVGMFLQRKR